jgi:hypothetical protein
MSVSFLHRFFGRIPLWGLTAFTAVALVASTLIGVSAFAQVEQQSSVALAQSIQTLQERVASLTPQRDALKLAVDNAQKALDDSAGKTQDEAVRTALSQALFIAQQGLTQTTDALAQAQAELDRNTTQQSQGFVLPWVRSSQAQHLGQFALPAVADIATLVSRLGEHIVAVQEAQTAWQAERDRQAAAAARAAAARAAAARAAAAAKTLAQSGGAMTPTAPAPPSNQEIAAPVTPGFSIENYIAGLAPNAYVVWVTDMCANKYPNQDVYLCGYATVNLNGANTDRVPITLDRTLADRYTPRQNVQRQVGLSVLVHEAAHARQWFKYGGNIENAWTTSTGLTGRPAVEYMADCATIVKLGYSTGTYTWSCDARDQAEAATYWQ